jgi:hypothetical protein
MKRYFNNLNEDLDTYLKEQKDVESTHLYKKLCKIKLLSDLHVLIKENKIRDIRNINATFTTALDDFEYKSEDTGSHTQLRYLTISFDYENYHIECVKHLWYHSKIDTPNVFDQPHGISSCQNYENYCDINFYDIIEWDATDKSERDELDIVEKINIPQKDINCLFDFIHLASLKICNYDPFEISYEEPKMTAYQRVLALVNTK